MFRLILAAFLLSCSKPEDGESCTAPEACAELDGCRDDGTCGECSADDECQSGRACVEGACLPTEMPGWTLSLSSADYTAMLGDPQADIWGACTLEADGVAYGPCEARFRGSSTRGYPKKSFRIEFPEDADHPGYSRKIDLRAEYNDPSFLRTFLGLEVARRVSGLPTPRARYLELSLAVDGVAEPYGLMLEVERVGADFLEDHGRDDTRGLYEASVPDPNGALTPEADPNTYAQWYSGEDDLSEVQSLVEDVLVPDWEDAQATGENAATRTLAAVHTDGYLGYLEAMALLQARDHVTNNFYFSRQRVDGKDAWEFYPVDMDLTFGCSWSDESGATCDDFTYDGWWLNGIITDDTLVLGETEYWCNLATHEVLTQTELSGRFEDELCDAAGSTFWNERVPQLAEATGGWIRDAVERDASDTNADLAAFDDARAEIPAFVTGRAGYLKESLGCTY